MPAFLRRMFAVGKLPDDLRTQLEAENVIDLAQNVGVILRFSGSVPGLHSGASISRASGALVFTSRRAVATLGTRSDPASMAVDCYWGATQPLPLKIEIAADGVKLDVDIHRVDSILQGNLSLHYKHKIPAEVLAQLPNTSLHQDISPEFVYGALGVRAPRTPKR